MRLIELKTQALRYVVLGDAGRALGLYAHLVGAAPTDLDVRMKVADVLVAAGMHDLARRVYAALFVYDLQLGRPLHAIVCAQALAALGEDPRQLYQPIAKRYAADSPTLATGGRGIGARLSPPDPDADVGAPVLPPGDFDAQTLRAYAEAVTARVASTTDLPAMERFPPAPLLSELPSDAFQRLLEHAVVRRVPVGTALVRQGEPGTSLFLVASGQVRVTVANTASRASENVELARLGEGAIFGELALVSAQPRAATVEAVTEVDVIELGVDALKSLAGRAAEARRGARPLHARSPAQEPARDVPAVPAVLAAAAARPRAPLHGPRARGRHRRDPRERGGPRSLRGPRGRARGRKGRRPVPDLGRGAARRRSLRRDLAHPRHARHRHRPRRDALAVLFLSREYFEKLVTALPSLREFFEQLSEDRLRTLKAAGLDEDVEELEDSAFLV